MLERHTETTRRDALFPAAVKGSRHTFLSPTKIALRRHGGRGSVRFTALGLQFLLAVYACPEEADADHSKRLGALEAVSLGVGLSVDSLAAGLGAGLGSVAILPTLAASLLLGMGMLAAGSACAPCACITIACKEADAFEKIAVCRAVRGVVPFHVRVQR